MLLLMERKSVRLCRDYNHIRKVNSFVYSHPTFFHMRYLTITVALSFVAAPSLFAQTPMSVMPSSRGSAEVTLLPTDSAARAAAKPSTIKVDYGQPHLRGRRIHTDSLVPYDTPWRTGANGPTTISTDLDIVLGGVPIPKGKYVLETLPGRSGWKLLVKKEVVVPEGTPAAAPTPATEIARIDMRQSALAAPMESLTMWLVPARGPGNARGQLIIAWDNVSLATDWSVK